ncbi:MAG: bifunctional (p)ppGpp synthetase/guanosine-3',5'-bis(diphosphate) 3'-pyrophosphohydrolase [Eubacteriales bacterium]|nr:bifunctional (p)ppGpp synthetase/guanosine-3',5'-bis(diphosphate) 3'-pyrophosphohydrolase [Eubacteriales bacterium]
MDNIIDKKENEIFNPPSFSNKDDLLNVLYNNASVYLVEKDIELIKKAYNIAEIKHKGQKRRSGEEYIIHPICVAIILTNLKMDVKTIVAGLLHDCVEDTEYTLDDVEKDFDKEVRLLVDGVTKLTKISLDTDKVEMQAENLRKMFLSMAKDVRVIIIKLADRLHNLRTLEYQTEEKQFEKATESLEIYSPIANRLGISRIKTIMDDLCLRYLEPKEYYALVEQIESRKEARQLFIDNIIKELKERLEKENLKIEVYGRVKNLFSIYKKMHNKSKTIDQIYDLFAVRILVNDVKDCYAVLGIIHEYYRPIPGRFKDYIAVPKQNNYQSLHTTVIGKDGIPFEIQIRTYEMHRVAEYGIAAHWSYKERNSSEKADSSEVNKMNWLKEILEINKDTDSSKEFLSFVKSDLDVFKEKIYALTPQGDVITLPEGSCPIDFAYAVHSAVGNKMVGAKVNSVLVPIDYKIKNGDVISILTSGNSNGPSRDWLNICKSSATKSKINHWFKTERRDENIARGKEQIDVYLRQKGLKKEDLFKNEYIESALRKLTCKDVDDLYAMVGHGGIKESQVIAKLYDEYVKDNAKPQTDEDIKQSILDLQLKDLRKKESQSKQKKDKLTQDSDKNKSQSVEIKGMDDLEFRFAKCCSPMPGDEIVGFVTRGRGITIHRTDCPNLMTLPDVERKRLIEANWVDESSITQNFDILLNIFTNNRKGLIVDISRMLTELNIDINTLESRTGKNEKATIQIGFSVSGKDALYKIIEKLKTIQGIIDIERI